MSNSTPAAPLPSYTEDMSAPVELSFAALIGALRRLPAPHLNGRYRVHANTVVRFDAAPDALSVTSPLTTLDFECRWQEHAHGVDGGFLWHLRTPFGFVSDCMTIGEDVEAQVTRVEDAAEHASVSVPSLVAMDRGRLIETIRGYRRERRVSSRS